MTINEILKQNKGMDYKVFMTDKAHLYNPKTDYITALSWWDIETDADYQYINWDVMSECDYNNTILSNSSETADFQEWYNDKDAKILVILLADNSQKWYAVMQDQEDTDWSCGSFDIDAAKEKAVSMGNNAFIAVIQDNECIEEIYQPF